MHPAVLLYRNESVDETWVDEDKLVFTGAGGGNGRQKIALTGVYGTKTLAFRHFFVVLCGTTGLLENRYSVFTRQNLSFLAIRGLSSQLRIS